jgi:RNA polymerase sigma factor (sigma-70 family)
VRGGAAGGLGRKSRAGTTSRAAARIILVAEWTRRVMGEDELRRYVTERFGAAARRLDRTFNGWADGEDAVQEALVRAWLLTERGEQISSWPGWISTVAANVAKAELRGRAAEERALRRVGLPPEAEAWPEPLARLGPVADAITGLPRRQAQVLVLHYHGDLSVAEIAAFLHVSEGTVKRALHRARVTLAGSLRAGRQAEATRRVRMKGWALTGSHSQEYALEPTEERLDGKPVVRLRYTGRKPGGFGAMVQAFRAQRYAGRRMRLSGSLRATRVADWAGLWFRVDGGRQNVLAFDNMQDRPVRGTTGWVRAEIVLDVPAGAEAVALGALLSGSGQLGVADLRFEEVGGDVPVTSETMVRDEPVNLDFTERDQRPAAVVIR